MSGVVLLMVLAGTAPMSDTASAEAPPAARSKVVVMPLQASAIDLSAVATLDELLTDAVRKINKHEVIGRSDIDAMLGLENLKDQLGCDDTTCAAELGGALGADFLVTGRLAGLGDNLIIVLKLMSTKAQTVVNSIHHKIKNDENLYDRAVEDAVAQLFGERAAPLTDTGGSGGDLLRSFISTRDFERYQAYKLETGREISLGDWVQERNRESTVLFGGEIAAAAAVLISAGLTAEYEPHIRDDIPVFGLTGLIALPILLAIDFLDIGSVEIIGQ